MDILISVVAGVVGTVLTLFCLGLVVVSAMMGGWKKPR